MIHRAAVASDLVLVTGASGGVGLAAVQLAKRRGATVIAVCSAAKAAQVRAHGAIENERLHAQAGAHLIETKVSGPDNTDNSEQPAIRNSERGDRRV